jgi:environmental stress-induced protein Ves
MKIVRQASFVATPWKNGGGITREAMRVPPVGDPLGWRVSVAQIDASSPFSDFSGYHRKIVLLREAGDLVEFDGAIATYGELVAGTCTDLNLIVSQARHTVRVQMQRLDAAVTLGPADGEPARVLLARISDAAANNGRWNDSNVR